MRSNRGPLLLGLGFILAIFVQNVPITNGANIVFFFGFSSYSHRVPAWPLVEALADKGHNVTFISPHPSKNPEQSNVFDYVPRTLKENMEQFHGQMNFFEERKKLGQNPLQVAMVWALLPMLGIMMCEELYKDEEYIKWVKSTKVDLVIVDALANDCAYGMAHHWDAKVIIFGTSAAFSYFPDIYGLPDETNSIPNMELYYPAEMTFFQRLKNALVPIAWHYYRKWTYFSKLEQLTREKLGMTDVPKFEELEKNASLIFLNTHFSEEFPRALPPNAINIGGITTVGKTKPLPKELDEFLKKGEQFIYMSFGTQTDFLTLDEHIQQAFIGAMKAFPKIQFVWKVDNLSLAQEFPAKNVYISKWMPQQDILAHPKIKAFITHSGLLGIQEAIHNAVPLISFPVFAEQDYNAERIHRKEYGIRLEINTVTQPEVEDAINRIITDPKYQKNMDRVSMLFKERPQKPLDTAMWWTEFVLRHSKEELLALRPLSVGQPWWVRRQLDVWATIFASIIAVLTSFLYVIYKLLKCVCGSKASSSTKRHDKSQKKKKQ